MFLVGHVGHYLLNVFIVETDDGFCHPVMGCAYGLQELFPDGGQADVQEMAV